MTAAVCRGPGAASCKHPELGSAGATAFAKGGRPKGFQVPVNLNLDVAGVGFVSGPCSVVFCFFYGSPVASAVIVVIASSPTTPPLAKLQSVPVQTADRATHHGTMAARYWLPGLPGAMAVTPLGGRGAPRHFL